jgi:hypothetical protein
MRRKVTIIIILLVLVWAVMDYCQKSKSSQSAGSVISAQATPMPTTIPVDTAVESASAKCHAQHVNLSDPQAFLPDPNCTSGEIDPAVTQENIGQTICKSGYTKTVRPSAEYTNRLKHEQITDYGYLDTKMGDFEEDHFISLELGGSPKDPRNLWPEPHASINEKDVVENYLHQQVCSGTMTLAQVQKAISKNWYEIYESIH